MAGLIIVVVTSVGGSEDGGDVVASPSSAGGGGWGAVVGHFARSLGGRSFAKAKGVGGTAAAVVDSGGGWRRPTV